MKLTVELLDEDFRALEEMAAREYRYAPLQAGWLIRQALQESGTIEQTSHQKLRELYGNLGLKLRDNDPYAPEMQAEAMRRALLGGVGHDEDEDDDT